MSEQMETYEFRWDGENNAQWGYGKVGKRVGLLDGGMVVVLLEKWLKSNVTKEKERRVWKHVGGVFWVEKSASVETRCGYEFGVLETVWLGRSEQGEW